MDNDIVQLDKLTNMEKKIFKWFGNSKFKAPGTNQIPIKMLDKAKSKFWISINVVTIVASSLFVAGSVYRYRHGPGE
ncbi:unnamed protein product [Gordionus sp. m RMFG-2023]